jgi:hypothetical protein
MTRAAAFEFDTLEYLSCERVQLLTLEEEGLQFRAIRAAAESGDIEFLAQFSFIGRYIAPSAVRRRIPQHIRSRVLSTGACAWCGSSDDLQVDHIFPLSRGGTDDEENLQPLCRLCNLRKGASA